MKKQAKQIKHNPYSDALASALKAVSEIKNPDFMLLPIEPMPDMCKEGARIGNISEECAGQVYFAMVSAWARANVSEWQKTAE